MAAAIDAMTPFGFPKKLVRAKMNYLLKEYGGHDGYPFIEADAYKVLIDALLAGEEEESNQGETSMKGDSSEGERVGDLTLLAAAGPSGGSIGSRGSETPNTELQTDRAEDGNRWKETCSQDERMVEATDNTGGSPVGDMHLHDPPVCSPPVVIAASPTSQSIPTQRRKPCYGWISDDDGEEGDLVVLTPAGTPTRTPSVAGQTESLSNGTVKQAKRKTRWDIRPEDM